MTRPVCGGLLAGGVAAGALCVCGPPARASQHTVGGARPGRHRRHRHVASSGADTVEDICTHVSCSVRVWRPAAARARRVTPWRDTCTPWCGPGRTSRCGKVEQRHVSRVTSHVSPCALCRAVGRLRSLRGLGRGSVRGHAGGGAAAALRHPHSALSLRSPGTQTR